MKNGITEKAKKKKTKTRWVHQSVRQHVLALLGCFPSPYYRAG